MLPEIKAAWTTDVLSQAAALYGAEAKDLRDSGGFENHVFSYDKEGKQYILRIGHTLHRTPEQVHAEIDWLNHLVAQDFPAASPSQSLNGRWVELIDQRGGSECFVAVAFKRAPGEDLGGGSRSKERWWNVRLFEQWGRLLGRLHRLASNYQVEAGAPHRPHWHQWPILEFERWIPHEEHRILDVADGLLSRIMELPSDRSSYGLIHGDFTQINFTVSRGAMTVFDFDRCEYGWFSKDIAIAFLTAVRGSQPISTGFPAEFLTHLIRGYRCERSMGSGWLKRIPDFMKLERLSEYALAHRRLGGSPPRGEWARYLADTKRDIEQDSQVIPFDFDAWADSAC